MEFNRLILKAIPQVRQSLNKDGRNAIEVAGWQGVSGEKQRGQKNAGLTVATLISTPTPVSQVLW
jgi:hypothetical protein